MKSDVKDFIHQCHTCQTTKSPNHKPYGLLQPLPIPQAPWHDISLDFITHLPPSNGKSSISVIVDRLTKFSHFIALPSKYTAASLATVFLKDIYRFHGLPKSILSDRDPLFLSHFWIQLFKQLGTKIRHSSAYHPQTDGQTEVVNRCLESYLRAFACDEPKSWHRYLYLAEFWYNTSFHSAIAMTPFKVMYGRDATAIHDYTPSSNATASIDATLQEHQRLIDLLKEALTRSRQQMTKQANKHRLDKEFKVGDLARATQKLSKRFFGPYQIIERIGKVTYRLALPPNSRIHNVFHVSLLKESHTGETTSDFPEDWVLDLPDQQLYPEQVLDSRNNEQDILVKWVNNDIYTATWESAADIQMRFPTFHIGLEDESNFTGKAIDTAQQEDTAGPSRPKRNTKKPTRLLD
ncbi:hypothetical protein LXL04_006159 [Taraxacum kok-saghyz]